MCVDDAAFDGSTAIFPAQLDAAITRATGQPIGALDVAANLDLRNRAPALSPPMETGTRDRS